MKCDSCIHKDVCKDKPPESYPQFMIDIMTDKCENYINNTDVLPLLFHENRWFVWVFVWNISYVRLSNSGESL